MRSIVTRKLSDLSFTIFSNYSLTLSYAHFCHRNELYCGAHSLVTKLIIGLILEITNCSMFLQLVKEFRPRMSYFVVFFDKHPTRLFHCTSIPTHWVWSVSCYSVGSYSSL